MYKLILVSESNYFASAVDLLSVLLLHLSIQVYLDVRLLSVLWSVTNEPYMGPIGCHALDVNFSFYTFHSSLVLSLTARTVEKSILFTWYHTIHTPHYLDLFKYLWFTNAGVMLSLPWSTRMKIALSAARGLAFLHEAEKPRVLDVALPP